jgi:hypothetical protein
MFCHGTIYPVSGGSPEHSGLASNVIQRVLNSDSMEKFLRVVGRRVQGPPGELPSAEARQAMTRMAQYVTRAPKGVFRYKSHEEANRDRENWRIAAMTDKQQSG